MIIGQYDYSRFYNKKNTNKVEDIHKMFDEHYKQSKNDYYQDSNVIDVEYEEINENVVELFEPKHVNLKSFLYNRKGEIINHKMQPRLLIIA